MSPKIEKTALEEMFAHIRAKTKWPIDSAMLWGYFFTDTNRAKLNKAADELRKRGYAVVGIREPTVDDDDQQTLVLHVERLETHNPESLYLRNEDLYKLADDFHLASYDGMDVGPPPL